MKVILKKVKKKNLNINNSIMNKEIKYKDERYVGQVINNKREGKGILYLNDGDRYEGDFKNGKYEGKGIYYYNNGNRYEGDYKNGKREGKAIFYFKNGDRQMGDWKDGKPIGKQVILCQNGEMIKKKEKEFIIFIMVIDMKVIIEMD